MIRGLSIVSLKAWLKTLAPEGRVQLAACASAFLLPWMLIFSRGTADGLAILIGILFLWRSATARDWQWLEAPIIRIGLAVWLWLIVISFFALEGRMLTSLGSAVPWIRYLLLYAAITFWLFTRRATLYPLSVMLLGMLAFVMFDTWIQYITGVSMTGHVIQDSARLSGPMGNVKVGLFMIKMLLPAVGLYLYFSLEKSDVGASGLSIVFLIAGLGMVMLSGERGPSLVGFISIMTIAFLMGLRDRKYWLAGLSLVTSLILLAVILYATQKWVYGRAIYLYETLADFKNTSYGQLFRVGYEIGKENLFTGAGLKGFRELCLGFLEAGRVHHCNQHPHNPYIEWFAETGLIGLMLFIALVGAVFQRAWRFLLRAQGHQAVLAAFAIGVWLLHFFPLIITQSIFSNWPSLLLWYSLSVAYAGLNLLKPDASS